MPGTGQDGSGGVHVLVPDLQEVGTGQVVRQLLLVRPLEVAGTHGAQVALACTSTLRDYNRMQAPGHPCMHPGLASAAIA